MKKFLVYLSTILVAVAITFTVYFLVRDNEVIALSSTRVYAESGVPFELELIYENKKAFSDYEVVSTDEAIASYNKETGMVTPGRGGLAYLTFKTTNVKYRNLVCEVHVGDGGQNNPYYISNVDQLMQIGVPTGTDELTGEKTYRYGLDKCYKLVNNINLKDGVNNTGYWLPLGYLNESKENFAGFTGRFDGSGYTIYNVTVDLNSYNDAILSTEKPDLSTVDFKNAGFFSKVGAGGRVYNVKFENFNVRQNLNEVEYKNISVNNLRSYETVGAVAGVNYGTIERVEVKQGAAGNALFDIQTEAVAKDGLTIAPDKVVSIGGIVGVNQGVETLISENNYRRELARIDRCSVMGNFGMEMVLNESAGAVELKDKFINNANIGGVVGYNLGGRVVYSYAQGVINAKDNSVVGGVVGLNEYFNCPKTNDVNNQTLYKYKYLGAHVKETYAAVDINKEQSGEVENTNPKFGSVIGELKDFVEKVDDVVTTYCVIQGNYYDNAVSEYTGVGSYVQQFAGSAVTNEKFEDDKDVDGKRNAYRVKGYDTETLTTNRSVYVVGVETDNNKETVITFNWDGAWQFEADNYPTLTYMEVEIDDAIDMPTSNIASSDELKNIKLDGHYVITQNINMSSINWKPIGTFDAPFIGTLTAANGAKIQNLTVTGSVGSSENNSTENEAEVIKYAGIFGVIAKPALIKNVIVENATYSNVLVAGAITAFNGFNEQVSDTFTHAEGGRIVNCAARGVSVTATQVAGGIVGANFGSVENCSTNTFAEGEINTPSEVTITPVASVFSGSLNSVGGIAGLNGGYIKQSSVIGSTEIQVSVLKDAQYSEQYEAFAGGIVGNNLSPNQSSETASVSHCVANDFAIVAGNKFLARLGGIAGVTNSPIAYCSATALNINSEDTNTEGINLILKDINESVTSYAGGIAGGTKTFGRIISCAVNGGQINAPIVGGVAAFVNYADPNVKFNRQMGNNNEILNITAKYNTVEECAINSTRVSGNYIAGLVAVLENGIVKNCYANASLNNLTDGSAAAGLIATLKLDKDRTSFMENVYSNCSFAKVGKNYSSTVDEILKTAVGGGSENFPKHSCGIGKNFYFNKTNADAVGAIHQNKGTFGDNTLWGDRQGALKDSEMKSSTNFVGFTSDIWNFSSDKTPQLKSHSNIGNANKTFTITIKTNNEEVKASARIEVVEGYNNNVLFGQTTKFKVVFDTPIEGASINVICGSSSVALSGGVYTVTFVTDNITVEINK